MLFRWITFIFLFMASLSIIRLSTLAADEFEADGRIGYFRPNSKLLREIYGSGMPLYQLELTYQYTCDWGCWINGGFTMKKGHSIGCHDNTRIKFYPLAAGIKYMVRLTNRLTASLGLGGVYTFLRFKDDSPYVDQHVNKNCFGGIAKLDLSYHFCNEAYVKVFFDYCYTKFHFSGTKDNIERHDLTLSGPIFGLGAGFRF